MINETKAAFEKTIPRGSGPGCPGYFGFRTGIERGARNARVRGTGLPSVRGKRAVGGFINAFADLT
jgi:hypothetical protein